MTPEQLERFERHVSPEPNSGCWLWTGWHDRKDYGGVTIDKVSQQAHRASYEHYVGPIPEGLVVDHLCRNTACVNPQHLEAVTCKVNLNRGIHRNAIKTHCYKGHAFTPENTRVNAKGGRACRTCARTYRVENWHFHHPDAPYKPRKSRT